MTLDLLIEILDFPRIGSHSCDVFVQHVHRVDNLFMILNFSNKSLETFIFSVGLLLVFIHERIQDFGIEVPQRIPIPVFIY
jgi:hypothetical protein